MSSDALTAYSLAGVTLRSDVRLPELGAPVAPTHAAWTFRIGASRPRLPQGGWFHHWLEANGRPWLSFGRDAGGYVLRFRGLATFHLDPVSRTIVCEGSARIPDNTLRHLLLNQVFPLALSTGNRVVLHASAVAGPAGVIGLAGDTGAGKSTLSAALSLAGLRLVGDDALVIEPGAERFTAVPMYAAVRLWPDAVTALFDGADRHPQVSHYTNKRIVAVPAVDGNGQERLALRVLCLLAPRRRRPHARQVVARPVSQRDALIRLTPHAFQLDVADPLRLRASFERLAAVVEEVPVVELSYPWRLAAVSDTAAAVLEALEPFS